MPIILQLHLAQVFILKQLADPYIRKTNMLTLSGMHCNYIRNLKNVQRIRHLTQ